MTSNSFKDLENFFEGYHKEKPNVQNEDIEYTEPSSKELKVLELKPEFRLMTQREAEIRKNELDTFSEDTGSFESLFVLTHDTNRSVMTTPDDIEHHTEMITEMIKLSVADKDNVWGLNVGGRLFKLVYTKYNGCRWSYFKVADDLRFVDFAVTPKGHIFAINAADRHLYKLQEKLMPNEITHVIFEDDPLLINSKGHRFEQMFEGDLQKLTGIAAVSHNAIYALDEQGQVLYLETRKITNRVLGWAKQSDQPHPCKKIAVSGGPHIFKSIELWGLTHRNQPMRYDKNSGTWKLFENEKLYDISVTDDNAVYGIRYSDRRLVKFNGLQFVLQDRYGNGNREGMTPDDVQELELLAALKESQFVWATDRKTNKLLRMIV